MAGSFTNYGENFVLNYLFNGSFNWYVALFTVAPTDTGGGTEVTGGSYARVLSNNWSNSTLGSVTNDAIITFPDASGSWGSVVAFAIFDALTVGNMLAWGDLTAFKTVASGDTVQFNTSNLTFNLD